MAFCANVVRSNARKTSISTWLFSFVFHWITTDMVAVDPINEPTQGQRNLFLAATKIRFVSEFTCLLNLGVDAMVCGQQNSAWC